MKKGLTLLLSLVLVLAMSVTAFAAEDWVTPVQNIEKWDEEVDFLVVGYGLAGAAAAVEAHDIDPNAKILVLEKMPETLAGGNSIASGQTFLVPAESAVETVKTYLYNCNLPNPIPDEYLTWLCNGFATQLPWIEYVADGVNYEAGYVGGGELKWAAWLLSSATSKAPPLTAAPLTCVPRARPSRTAACGAASPRRLKSAASTCALRTRLSPSCRIRSRRKFPA